ncbi:MAG TPA: AMP-binding protein [Thermoanaerobaculia bacterium]|nr:AMP-binding protein [Thermoanaerobaculia bacterium]
MIEWSGNRTHVLLNPRMPLNDQEKLERRGRSARLPGHIIIATSGSSGGLKLVALSKEAVLASAAAVNERLEATGNDVWWCSLPTFHVGGLGIYARAHLSGARVISMSWVPQVFATTEATLASLVPAQVHDLVNAGLEPPSRMRAILVGGGSLHDDLNEKARALGWPVLPSYGMSECSSTIAVCDVLLSHIEAREQDHGRLAFRGPSLFTAYITDAGVVDPKVSGWFLTDDVGQVDGRTLHVYGRQGDFIKIGGESVDLARLDRVLESVRGSVDAAIVAVVDERLGNVIHLASTSDAEDVIRKFNESVLPFERIRDSHLVPSIPRSSLGKLLRSELARRLTSQRNDDRNAVERPERDRQ